MPEGSFVLITFRNSDHVKSTWRCWPEAGGGVFDFVCMVAVDEEDMLEVLLLIELQVCL